MLNYLILILLAMSPISENRGAILYGLSTGMPPLLFLSIAMFFNILVIFPLFWFLKKARIRNLAHRLLGKRIARLINKNRDKLEAYEELALLFFVAIPLPGTGAWTGALLASILNMKPRKSKLLIAIGILIAGAVVFLSAQGLNLGVTGLMSLLK